MNQMQPPTPEKKQEQGMPSCYCFSKVNTRCMIKAMVLILLGLVIAIPGLGRWISQYFYVFLGAFFIAWGVFILFFKGKEKKP